jgi:hypothetical protein
MRRILKLAMVAMLSVGVIVLFCGCEGDETDATGTDGSEQTSEMDGPILTDNAGEAEPEDDAPQSPADIAGYWLIERYSDDSPLGPLGTCRDWQITQSGAEISIGIPCVPGPPPPCYTGTVSGRSVVFSDAIHGGETTFAGTIAADANSMSGTWVNESNGGTGTWQATRQ